MSKLKSTSSSKANNESVTLLNEPLDNVIYKVKQLINNKVDTIYVFYGKIEKDIGDESFLKKISLLTCDCLFTCALSVTIFPAIFPAIFHSLVLRPLGVQIFLFCYQVLLGH